MNHAWDIGPVRDDDIEAVVGLIAARIGGEDGVEARLVLEDPSFDRRDWLVARSEGELAATGAIFTGTMRLGTERFAAGNIEFVATHQAFEGRGAVRSLMAALHRRSAERGDEVIVIVGIPYFYRLFGYEYAVPDQSLFVVEEQTEVGGIGDLRAEPVSELDVADYQEVQRLLARTAEVALEHSDQVAYWLVASPNYEVGLIRGPTGASGAYRMYDHNGQPLLYDVAAADPETLACIIGAARTAYPGKDVTIVGRRATPLDAVLGKVATRIETRDAYYLRVPDLGRLLQRLRPVLQSRLAASSLAGWSGTILLSTYRASLTAVVEDGSIGDWIRGPGVQAPVAAGGSGVPPDLVATLLFGPLGAGELERRHADVKLGRHRELMSVLFPPVTADLLTWVKP